MSSCFLISINVHVYLLVYDLTKMCIISHKLFIVDMFKVICFKFLICDRSIYVIYTITLNVVRGKFPAENLFSCFRFHYEYIMVSVSEYISEVSVYLYSGQLAFIRRLTDTCSLVTHCFMRGLRVQTGVRF